MSGVQPSSPSPTTIRKTALTEKNCDHSRRRSGSLAGRSVRSGGNKYIITTEPARPPSTWVVAGGAGRERVKKKGGTGGSTPGRWVHPPEGPEGQPHRRNRTRETGS